MSESITFGSVHQKRSARAQTLRHARASCRESRFQAKKEIGRSEVASISVTLPDQNPSAMSLKIVRFLDLLLVTFAFGMSWCHAMEIAGKLRLPGPQWLAVQHHLYIAFGPPLGAPIEIAWIAQS
jgi:hypothetical protein